ncbi:hypothetical protein ACFWDG_23245, partial [Peribacillus sp. NPDC060186]
MKELMLRGNKSISNEVYESEIIRNGYLRTVNTKANEIVAGISHLIPSSEQLKQIINPKKVYIAQFPKEIIEKMKSGEYDLMHTKSGEILSNIVDKTLPKNKNIVHNVRLSELDPNMMDKVKNLSNSVANMAIQQQLGHVLEELTEVKKLAVSIKRGQTLDRIGKVYAGKRQLENALDASPEQRIALIHNAIQSLEEGRTQLEYNLKEEIKKIKEVPTSKFKILIKYMFNNGFY